MQLREIQIDGFGMFSGKPLAGLKEGVNVILGRNEQGKTTLRFFIERILFGFPKKGAKINPYPAIAGGGYGGRLVCALSNEKTAVISRQQGARKSVFKVTIDARELSGDDEIRALLGNITGTFYHNVYSFDLEEFAVLGSLNSDELRQRVYGAAEGLNSVSISAIKAGMQVQADGLFLKAGQNPVMNKLLAKIGESENLIAEMRSDLSKYDGLIQRRQSFTEEVQGLTISQKAIRDRIRDLAYKKSKFAAYVDLTKAQKDLSLLSDAPDISPESYQEVTGFIAEISGLDKHIADEIGEKTELEHGLGRLGYNQKLIDKEPIINMLVGQSALFANALRDKGEVSAQSDAIKNSIDTETVKLGMGWTVDKVRDFQLTYEQLDKISQLSSHFLQNQDAARTIRDKLTAHREQLALAKPLNNVWEQVKIPLILLAGASIIGIVAGLIFNQPGLSIFSGLLLMISMVFIFISRKEQVSATPDQLEQVYLSGIENTSRARDQLDGEWKDLLNACNLDVRLSPDGVRAIIASIDNIQSDLKDYERHNQRLRDMTSAIKTVEDAYADARQSVAAADLSGVVGADIKMLSTYLSDAKVSEAKARSQNEAIELKSSKINGLNGEKSALAEKLNARFSAFCCSDEEDFRDKYVTASKRRELNNTISSLVRQIQEGFGVGQLYESFIQSLSQTDLLSIETSLDEAGELDEQTGGDIVAKSAEIGELTGQINRLASEVDVSRELDRLEVLKQNLNNASKDWARLQLAATFIEKAISKYEITGQPEVFKEAAAFFNAFTRGAYINIYKPAGEETLRVVDSKSLPREIETLSTGTMQQLYLAIRFGLIQACERQTEPMPIIMDDLLVNFDDIRTQAAMQQIVDFARGRQVIYLTCHGATCDAFAKLGIEAIEI